MTDVDEQGRTEPPLDGDELQVLVGFLEYQRQTLQWKTSGLTADQLSTPIPTSPITLGGLLKHVSCVEHRWFVRRLSGLPAEPPWDAVDWEADQDWDWHSAAGDTPDELLSLWHATTARSRELLAAALERGGLEQPLVERWPDGRAPSLRWLLTHMIEEYSRHNGHADLLREAIDGQVGE